MSLLFETIRITGGRAENLKFHEWRMNRSRSELFGTSDFISLEAYLKDKVPESNEVIRCRVNYSESIESVEFSEYIPAETKTFKIVYCDKIHYSHKYTDRNCLLKLIDKNIADDILLAKGGYLTDISYGNIVFTDGLRWVTPDSPLLRGTMRESLLQSKIITEAPVRTSDLRLFSHFRIINAMLGFSSLLLPVKNILQ